MHRPRINFLAALLLGTSLTLGACGNNSGGTTSDGGTGPSDAPAGDEHNYDKDANGSADINGSSGTGPDSADVGTGSSTAGGAGSTTSTSGSGSVRDASSTGGTSNAGTTPGSTTGQRS